MADQGVHEWTKSGGTSCGVCKNFWSSSSELTGFYSCNNCSLEAHGQCRDFAQKLHTCTGNDKLRLLHLHPPTNVLIKGAVEQRGFFKVRLLGISVDLGKPMNLELKGSHLYVSLNIRGIDGVIRTDGAGPLDEEGNSSYSQNDHNEYSLRYTGVAVQDNEPILHAELWKSVMVILDSCVGVEDISLLPMLMAPNTRVVRKFLVHARARSPASNSDSAQAAVAALTLSLSFVPSGGAKVGTGGAVGELSEPISGALAESRDREVVEAPASLRGSRAAFRTPSATEKGKVRNRTSSADLSIEEHDDKSGHGRGSVRGSPASSALRQLPHNDAQGSPKATQKAPGDSEEVNALKKSLSASYDALEMGAGAVGIRRRRLPGSQAVGAPSSPVSVSGGEKERSHEVSRRDVERERDGGVFSSTNSVSHSTATDVTKRENDASGLPGAPGGAVSWALRSLWSASESVIRLGTGGKDGLGREPLQSSIKTGEAGSNGSSSASHEKDREDRTRAVEASTLVSQAIGIVHLTLNSVYRTDITDASQGSYYVVAGMADDDKDGHNEGVHWQRSRSVFHSATPQFDQVFSFPARRYDSELVLSLYDAISHRKVGEASESVYKIVGSAADRHLSPLEGWVAAYKDELHLPLRDVSDSGVVRGYFSVRLAFAERTHDLFLSSAPVKCPEREPESLSVERLTLHIARFQALIGLVNEWGAEYARLMSWERPLFTLLTLFLFVVTTLYLPADYFLSVPVGLVLLLLTHALYRRHTLAYRSYWISKSGKTAATAKNLLPVGVMRVAIGGYRVPNEPETTAARSGSFDGFELSSGPGSASSGKVEEERGGGALSHPTTLTIPSQYVCYKLSYVPMRGDTHPPPCRSGGLYEDGSSNGGRSRRHSESMKEEGDEEDEGGEKKQAPTVSPAPVEEEKSKAFVIGYWGTGSRSTGNDIVAAGTSITGGKQLTKLMESLHIISDKSTTRDDFLHDTLDVLDAVELYGGRQYATSELGFAYPVQQPRNYNSSGGLDLDEPLSEQWLPWEENESKVVISLYDSRANGAPRATSTSIISANNDVSFGTVEYSLSELTNWALLHHQRGPPPTGGDTTHPDEWACVRRGDDDGETVVEIRRWLDVMGPPPAEHLSSGLEGQYGLPDDGYIGGAAGLVGNLIGGSPSKKARSGPGPASTSTASISGAPMERKKTGAQLLVRLQLKFKDVPSESALSVAACGAVDDMARKALAAAEASAGATSPKGAEKPLPSLQVPPYSAGDGGDGTGPAAPWSPVVYSRNRGTVHSRWLSIALTDALSDRSTGTGGAIETLWNMPENIKYVQNLMSWLLDLVESAKNLMNWSSPARTWPLYLLLFLVFMLTVLVKNRYIVLVVGLQQFFDIFVSGPSSGITSPTSTKVNNFLHSIPNDDDIESKIYQWERRAYRTSIENSEKRYVGMARLNLTLPCLWADSVELKIAGIVTTTTSGPSGEKKSVVNQLNTPWRQAFLVLQGRRLVWWASQEDLDGCRAHEGQLLLREEAGLTQVSPVDLRDTRLANKKQQLICIFASDVSGTYLKASVLTSSVQAAECLSGEVKSIVG